MNDSRSAKDRNGKLVHVGDSVRILELDSKFMGSLPEDELDDVRSMIGEVREIEEIDKYGSAWVSKVWDRGDGRSESHGVALSAAEMELVEIKDAN